MMFFKFAPGPEAEKLSKEDHFATNCITSFGDRFYLSLLIDTFATLTCEGRKEIEHAGDARMIK